MTSGTDASSTSPDGAAVAPTVGDEAARAVHGLSAGADVVLLGGDRPSDIMGPLTALGVSGSIVALAGALSDQLLGLAETLERTGSVPAVVAAHDLVISEVALLDLLDRPGVRTAALAADPYALTEGADLATTARVGRDGKLVESAGTTAHVVTAPNRALPGILRIAAPDRAVAARLLRAAAPLSATWGSDAVAVATLVLVRGGLTVQASPLGPFDWSRPGVRAVGAAGEPWRQRLRGASRGGDGFFSTYAVRPLSRRLTAVGLAHGWTPNVVTMVSLAFGVVAALLVATGARWAWVLAAVLLLVALVVDCVDGEIARFTRRFSPLGAFLDAVGDRVKEYAVLAAVAAVAVREGSDGWPLALAAMAVVTLRHLEDYAYEHRLRGSRLSRPDLLAASATRDLGPQGARTTFAPAPSTHTQVVHWTKKVVHMPIAERYLLIALTLLTGRPMLVLWVLTVAVALAVAWTQGGRVAAVLARRDPTWAAVVRPERRGDLDEQLDLGPLAVTVGRVARRTVPRRAARCRGPGRGRAVGPLVRSPRRLRGGCRRRVRPRRGGLAAPDPPPPGVAGAGRPVGRGGAHRGGPRPPHPRVVVGRCVRLCRGHRLPPLRRGVPAARHRDPACELGGRGRARHRGSPPGPPRGRRARTRRGRARAVGGRGAARRRLPPRVLRRLAQLDRCAA